MVTISNAQAYSGIELNGRGFTAAYPSEGSGTERRLNAESRDDCGSNCSQ